MHVEEMKNGDPENIIISLYNRAQRYVWVSSDFNPEFYNREGVKNAITEASERVQQFFMLIDEGIDVSHLRSHLSWVFDLARRGKIKIKQSLGKIRHWIISDGKHFRLEESHEANAIIVNNLIVWNASKSVQEVLKHNFLNWWHNGTPL